MITKIVFYCIDGAVKSVDIIKIYYKLVSHIENVGSFEVIKIVYCKDICKVDIVIVGIIRLKELGFIVKIVTKIKVIGYIIFGLGICVETIIEFILVAFEIEVELCIVIIVVGFSDRDKPESDPQTNAGGPPFPGPLR